MESSDVPNVVAGAGGVVFSPNGRILVLRHLDGSWVFPKGHIDPGESRLGAALREVEEEAGIRCHCPNPDMVEETRYLNSRGEQRLVYWYGLVASSSKLELREELFPDGAFLTPEEATARLTFDEDRDLLARMLAWWRGREQDVA